MLAWKRAMEDRSYVLTYEKDLDELWRIEDAASKRLPRRPTGWGSPLRYQEALQRAADKDPLYKAARERIALETKQIKRIASENGVNANIVSIPPSEIGGPTIPNLFDSVLRNNSYGGITHQHIRDALIQTIGAAVEREKKEFCRMLNPLRWLKDTLVFVLRIPFMIIEATGFSVEKVEDHLLAKLFKIVEFVFYVWLGVRLGTRKELIPDFLAHLLSK